MKTEDIIKLVAALVERDTPEQNEATSEQDSHWEIGVGYGIRTVTMIYTGRLLKVTDKELVIDKACWIPDSGRWHEFAAKGKLTDSAEVEPYLPEAEIIIGRGALLDAFKFTESIPTSQK